MNRCQNRGMSGARRKGSNQVGGEGTTFPETLISTYQYGERRDGSNARLPRRRFWSEPRSAPEQNVGALGAGRGGVSR
jgi:hypothetical protein